MADLVVHHAEAGTPPHLWLPFPGQGIIHVKFRSSEGLHQRHLKFLARGEENFS